MHIFVHVLGVCPVWGEVGSTILSGTKVTPRTQVVELGNELTHVCVCICLSRIVLSIINMVVIEMKFRWVPCNNLLLHFNFEM